MIFCNIIYGIEIIKKFKYLILCIIYRRKSLNDWRGKIRKNILIKFEKKDELLGNKIGL